MSKIEKIRQEIERLKATNPSEYNYQNAEGYVWALNDILSFISDLESETTYDTQQYIPRHSVNIGDVTRVQFASHAKVFDKKRKAVFDWEQFKEVASIFYGFGKKDSSDTLESEKPNDQVVEGEVILNGHGLLVDVTKWGDGYKLKVIIKEN